MYSPELGSSALGRFGKLTLRWVILLAVRGELLGILVPDIEMLE
jgi:hypothetical protein